MTTKIAVFKGKKIRKIIHKNEWWFSVVDVAQAFVGFVQKMALLKHLGA